MEFDVGTRGGWLRHCESKQGSSPRDPPAQRRRLALAGVTSITRPAEDGMARPQAGSYHNVAFKNHNLFSTAPHGLGMLICTQEDGIAISRDTGETHHHCLAQ